LRYIVVGVAVMSRKLKGFVAGLCLLIPSLIVLYYGSVGASLYLVVIGVFGVFTSGVIFGGFKYRLPTLYSASFSLLFFTHLFIVLVPASLQIKFFSAASLFLLFIAFYFSLD